MLEAEIYHDLSTLDSIFVEIKNQLVPYFIQSISVRGQKAFLKFEDVESIEQAEEISKSNLYLPKKDRPKSKKGEFYADEVIDFQVEDESAGPLGTVSAIIQSGPNRLLQVNRDGEELLIPINGPFIKAVDRSKGLIKVNLPEGFLDFNS